MSETSETKTQGQTVPRRPIAPPTVAEAPTEPVRARRSGGAGSGGDATRDERLEVLRLLESGAITADETAALLDALDRSERADRGGERGEPAPRAFGGDAKRLRLRVSDASGKAKVNLVLPMGLLDAGLGIARRFAPDQTADATAMRDALREGFRGPLLDVDDNGERVEIVVE